MQNDAHPAISTSGTRGQSVRAAISHLGSNARPNFVTPTKISGVFSNMILV